MPIIPNAQYQTCSLTSSPSPPDAQAQTLPSQTELTAQETPLSYNAIILAFGSQLFDIP